MRLIKRVNILKKISNDLRDGISNLLASFYELNEKGNGSRV